MKNKLAYTILWIGLSLVAEAQTPEEVIPNKILVKLEASVLPQLSTYLSQKTPLLTTTGEPSWDQLNQRYGVVSIRPVFPTTARSQTAHRRFGLHRWYEITFGDTLTTEVQALIAQYQNSPLVTLAEPAYLRHLDTSLPTAPRSTDFANDPRSAEQWHYRNTGQSGGTPRADIQLGDAWAIERGAPRVIVAIIDGGVDTQHEDLRAALWVNRAEQAGQPGVDDDGNGYVDDLHGYNFADRRGRINANAHGTHVAGVVGAVSRNGVGVAGVAGGSGTGDGVRLMSCTVFGSSGQGGFAEALVYAADHGAVIAQNSWGGGARSEVLEDAIRYFIERAGYDNTSANFEKNQQIGPMAGGLVTFAAGNDRHTDARRAYPASLPTVLTVAATDHHDRRSPFSNYGTWIDISAPGSGILSTYPSDTYDTLSGTSMACPQVSGVAALLVSRYQQPGLRPEHVRRLLLNGVDPLDERNPDYAGRLGRGRLNAYRALTLDRETAPGAITDLVAQSLAHDQVQLTWTASGGDSTRGAAAHYELCYAPFPITEQNVGQATPVSTAHLPSPSGSQDTTVVANLGAESTYYFALRTRDLLGSVSPWSNVVSTTTLAPPVISVRPTSVALTLKAGTAISDTVIIANSDGRSRLDFSVATAATRPWLRVDVLTDTVVAGEQTPVVLTVDTRLLVDGQYRDTLIVTSNDPRAPRTEVPVAVSVVGIPRLRVAATQLDWGRVPVATPSTNSLTLTNPGTAPLEVTPQLTKESVFRADTSLLVLSPGERHVLTLSLTAAKVGTVVDTLVVRSNAPEQPVRRIALVATVVPPPLLVPEPASLALTLSVGDTTVRTVRLRSASEDTLTWTLSLADQPGWWTALPSRVALPPDTTTDVHLRLNATSLRPGTYRDTLTFRSDRASSHLVMLPITLTVNESIAPLSVADALPGQHLPLADTTYLLDLRALLQPSAEPTQYAATSEDTSVLYATVDQARLLLSPRAIGTTAVQISVRDSTQEVQTSLRVMVVAPNASPEVVNFPETITLAYPERRTLVVSKFFADPDRDSLTYTVASADPTVVAADLDGSTLTLRSRSAGQVRITLVATDPAGAQVSLPLVVEVATVTALLDAPPTLNLRAYPNPSGGRISVAYEVPYSGWVRLEIYNEYGRRVRTLAAEYRAVGRHTVRSETALSSGMYLLRLSVRDAVVTRRVVVRSF